MATNKNAQLRYQVLDRCFSNRQQRYYIEDLVEYVNERLLDMTGSRVSLRQIRDDIRYMRDSAGYDAPIEAVPFDGRRCFYRYSDPEFRIFRKEISDEALEAVRKTIGILNQYRGLPANGWMEEVISSIEVNLGLKPNVESVVSLEKNDGLKGLQFLRDIIDFTIGKQPLVITYKPFGREERPVILHPYHVRQYNNRWFLWGWDEGNGFLANLALDRIVSIRKSDSPFRENTDIDFQTYFDDIIGVTVPRGEVAKEKFVLQFSPSRFPYVVSKPLHHSQQIVGNMENAVSVELKPNNEFESLIFSFGADVRIVSPHWYRAEIASKIEKIFNYYQAVQNGCTEAP